LTQILKNMVIAAEDQVPMCQDTGTVVVFAEVAQDLHIAGGTFDSVARLAKHALLREIGSVNSDPEAAGLEAGLLTEINKLGIGPHCFGGRITAVRARRIVPLSYRQPASRRQPAMRSGGKASRD
jgi:tartrate dehydratase alpha subunit/fumarate hydratase class I-like protein